MPPHGCPRTGAPISRNVLQRLLPSSFLAVLGDPVVLQAPTPQSGPSRASINWRIVARIVSTVSGLVRSAQCSSTRRPAVLPIGRTARPRAVSRTNRARPDLGRRGQPVWHDVLPTAVPASASCPAPVTPVTGSRCPGRSESGPVGAAVVSSHLRRGSPPVRRTASRSRTTAATDSPRGACRPWRRGERRTGRQCTHDLPAGSVPPWRRP